MRVSRDTVARHRAEIVKAAAMSLRVKGITGLNVADLMQSVGLTHGGFYRHFVSKDALIAEAIAAAFEEISTAFFAGKSDLRALANYVDNYLSRQHLDNPGLGCPIPAFGAEAARESEPIRKAFSEGVEQLLAAIAACFKGTPEKQQAQALELLSILVGAVVAARALKGAEASQRLLITARQRAHAVLATGRSAAR